MITEEWLLASEERFNLAQSSANLGVWDWDITTNRVTRTEIHYRLFGRLPGNGPDTYESWLQQVHPDDRERVRTLTEEALRSGYMDCEFRALWPDGSSHWIQSKGKVYFDKGMPVRMLRVAQDITGRKHAEQALRDSEARKDAIVRTSLDAVLIMNAAGLLQEFNPAAQEMFLYRREEAIGRPLGELIVPPALRELHYEGLRRYLLTGEAKVLGRRFEIEAMRSDGSLFPVELAIVRVAIEGAPLFAGYIRDITQRKRFEQELRRSNEDFSQFAHLVAHDLQAPLRTIKGFTQLLVDGLPDKLSHDAQEYRDLILQGVEAMQELIQALLAFAVVGRKDLPTQLVNLEAAFQGAMAALQAAVAESGAVIYHDTLPEIASHPVLIQQLFQNLIGNAIKYRKREQAPKLVLRVVKNEKQWLFSLADNGIGIAPEHHSRIFAPLTRLHGHEIPGTGLGLAVCKKIVEMQGGQLWLESELGQGSTFFFTVPA